MGEGQCTAASFMVLCLGLAAWGVAITGMRVFWVGWSIAALFAGYVLAFRMDFLTKIADTIKEYRGLSQFWYVLSLALFSDSYALVVYNTPLSGIDSSWLAKYATIGDALSLFVVYLSFYHLAMPRVWVFVSVRLPQWGVRLNPAKEKMILLCDLDRYATQMGDAWAQKVHDRELGKQKEVKQVELLCASVLLLVLAEYLWVLCGGKEGSAYVFLAKLVGLPWLFELMAGFIVADAFFFLLYMVFRRDRQLDGWIKGGKLGNKWLEQHGAEFWDDDKKDV